MEFNRFTVPPQVLQETISEEVVIINMVTGSYYSLTETGAEVWDMLEREYSSSSIHRSLAQKYEASEALIHSAVTDFITHLQAEGIIVPVELDQATHESAHPLEITPSTDAKPRFVPPILHKYNDMQELLLVDPIHDVDESGWPNLKQAA
jgi:Coenzyme PQQ synthesis protein D (PqqD)